LNDGINRFSALVLAGERPGGSPFSRELGLPASVLVDVVGKTAVARVLECLQASETIDHGLLVGPAKEIFLDNPDFSDLISRTDFSWVEPESGPSVSVISGIEKLADYPVLVTAADHALLTPEIVNNFCRAASARCEDVIVGLVPYNLVKNAFPDTKRTVLTFSNGRFCGSNLFAIKNPNGLAGPRFWQQVEADRKRPWRMVMKLGPMLLARYLMRMMSLEVSLQALSNKMGCRVGIEIINDPRVAVDVDSVSDLKIAEKVIQSETNGTVGE
jgi:GTP:adenosylcobinamide-phosphate guanylyltransferase